MTGITLEEAEEEARRARAALSRMEHESFVAREAGQSMPGIFWERFGIAWASVKVAEHAVNKLLEKAR